MKKFFVLVLALVMCISLVACGGQSSTGNSSGLNVSDVASTDIVDFTILDSALAVYVGDTTDKGFLLPSEKKTNIGAPVGKSLVSVSFTVSNKDRAGYLNINTSEKKENSMPLDWKLTYGGKTYDITSYMYSYDRIGFTPAAFINGSTGEVLDTIGTNNYLLEAGKTISFRVIGVVDVEPDSLDDSFGITVKLPNSTGKQEKFTYTIN